MRANRLAAPYDAPGAIFYNTNQYRAKGLIPGLKSSVFSDKALPPAMDWKATDSLSAPTDIALAADGMLTWQHAESAPRYSVYVYPKGTAPQFETSGRYLYDIAWEQQIDLSKVADRDNKSIIVCALDRYGNEFAPAFYNRADTEVVDSIDVHVTGIKMRLTEAKLKVGESIALNPTITPSNASVKTIIWTSSNEDVAIVWDNGTVIGFDDGEAIITGTTLDGGYQVFCKITVYGGSGLREVEGEHHAELIFYKGQLLIRRGDTFYDTTGKRVL
jgi:hypothetical protein